MATMSVPFEEHVSSPMPSGSINGDFNFLRTFIVEWSDSNQFLIEMFNNGPLGLPQRYSTVFDNLYAKSFRFEYPNENATSAVPTMTNPETQMIGHNGKVFIHITYDLLDFDVAQFPDPDIPPGTWVEYERQDAGEFVSVPGRAVKWESDSQELPADVNPSVISPEVRHILRWNRVRNVPWEQFSRFKGKVNADQYRLPGTSQVFEPETLLFESANDSGVLFGNVDSSLPPSRTLTLTYIEKSQVFLHPSATGAVNAAPAVSVYGWNHQFREDTGEYDKILNAVRVNPTPVFQPVNLGLIFQ